MPAPRLPHPVLLYHFCRLQLPGVNLRPAAVETHLQRTHELYRAKGHPVQVEAYLENLYVLDWFVAIGCLEGDRVAWRHLHAARASRTDCLLEDALRARAVRLYPRDEERQDSAVREFWSQLIVTENEGSLPILARYDGQRPLVPWLIRVFQNKQITQLRGQAGRRSLPEDDLALPLPETSNGHWHEAFCLAARESLTELTDAEMLILGLRFRYRLSQREVAHLLGVHEGTISRQTSALRDKFLEDVGQKLVTQGWTGEGLTELVQNELGGLILDEPRLSVDALARLLAARGKKLPTAGAEA